MIKLCIGPLSKNIVDATIEFCNDAKVKLGLIPTRRQIDFDNGYVNHWNTKSFTEYVRSKTDKIMIMRDHAGPLQNSGNNDGFKSLDHDLQHCDLIHIDVWIKHPKLQDGIHKTVEYIEYCHNKTPNILFEVATEEAIRRFEVHEIDQLLNTLQKRLGKVFRNIIFCVIQSGTSIASNKNTGSYDSARLRDMINLVKSYGLLSKEHNADYLSGELLSKKFQLGLDCINIAPEFGAIETTTVMGHLNSVQINDLFHLCLGSNRWQKWVDKDYNPYANKREVIMMSGHYVFSNDRFMSMKNTIDVNVDLEIKNNIKKKIGKVLNGTVE